MDVTKNELLGKEELLKTMVKSLNSIIVIKDRKDYQKDDENIQTIKNNQKIFDQALDTFKTTYPQKKIAND